MRKYLSTNLTLVLFVLLTLVTDKAKSQNFSWAKNIGGSVNETGNAITTDIYSNVYVTGAFQGTVDFDPGTAVCNLISSGGDDIFVAKYTQDGSLIWAIKIGGTIGDMGSGIAVDRYGNVFFVGSFMGTVDFNAGTGVNSFTSNGSQDIFIAKYSSSGAHLWAFGMGSNNWDVAEDVEADTLGCVYFTGYFTGTIDFNPTSGVNNLTSKGTMDVFIAKYNSNGTFSFANSLGSTGMDWGTGIKTDVSGNIYVTGVFSETVDFDPGSNTYNLTSAGNTDVYVAKYSNTGNLIWAIGFGGTYGDSGYSLDLDKYGNVYAAGGFEGIIDFDPGNGTAIDTSSGGSDIYVVKFNNSGKYIWAYSAGGNTLDKSNSIAVDYYGNSYLTGEFESTVDFDNGKGVHRITSSGINDSYILKLDSNGSFIWAYNIGGSYGDIGYSITAHDSGNVFATGFFCTTVDFNPGSGVCSLTSKGANDMYITKISNAECKYFKAITNPTDSAKLCQGSYLELKANSGLGLTYQWLKNGVAINGATTSKYKAATAGYYAVVVTNSGSCTDTSSPVLVSIIQPPNANIIANGPITFCYGDSVKLNANTGKVISWQWKKDGKDIAGATDSILVTKSSGDYTVIITNTAGCSKQSSKIKITVNNLPDTSVTINGNLSFCMGDSVLFTAKTTSGLNYQWSKDGIQILGATHASYSVTQKGVYKLITTTLNSCVDSSSAIKVVVNSLPNANISTSGKSNFCEGDSVIFQTQAGFNYQWIKDGNNLIGESDTLLIVKTTGFYSVLVTDGKGCKNESKGLAVNVNKLPDISISNNGKLSFCMGDSVILSAVSDTGLSYQWKLNDLAITGAINPSYSVVRQGSYKVVITSSSSCIDSSSIVEVVVFELPDTTITVIGSTSFCEGDSVVLEAKSGLNYQWMLNGEDIPGANNLKFATKLSGNYSIKLTDTNACTSFTSPIKVIANPKPDVYLGQDTTICKNHSLLLDAGIGYTSYLWSTGATSQTLLLDNNIDTGDYSYWVKTTNSYGCTTTDTIVITIKSCSDIDEMNGYFKIHLFPNPSNGNFTLSINGIQSETGRICISDMTGKSIIFEDFFEFKTNNLYQNFNLSYLPEGIYFIIVKTDNLTTFNKIIIQ